jgi:hypothetical protein
MWNVCNPRLSSGLRLVLLFCFSILFRTLSTKFLKTIIDANVSSNYDHSINTETKSERKHSYMNFIISFS